MKFEKTIQKHVIRHELTEMLILCPSLGDEFEVGEMSDDDLCPHCCTNIFNETGMKLRGDSCSVWTWDVK